MHRNDFIVLAIGIVIVLVAIPGSFIMGEKIGSGPETAARYELRDGFKRVEGSTEEGRDTVTDLTLPEGEAKGLVSLSARLTWRDEPDKAGPAGQVDLFTNTPDTFELTIDSPVNRSAARGKGTNEHGSAGVITLRVESGEAGDAALVGSWRFIVHCVQAGDYMFLSYTADADTGNAWVLDITYSYVAEVS